MKLPTEKAKIPNWVKYLVSLLLVLSISIAGYYKYYSGLIQVPASSSQLKGRLFSDVKADFKTKGFKNIKLKAVSDLDEGTSKNQTVISVSIGKDSTFKSKKRYSPNKIVTISYHSFSSNAIDFSNISLTGSKDDVLSALKAAGFKKVSDKKNDITSGSKDDIGKVALTVNGKTPESNKRYSAYTDVVVQYNAISVNSLLVSGLKISKEDDYKSVLEKLKQQGFTNISAKASETTKVAKHNKFKALEVDGSSIDSTNKINDTIVEKNKPIVIYYYDATKQIEANKKAEEKKKAEEEEEKERIAQQKAQWNKLDSGLQEFINGFNYKLGFVGIYSITTRSEGNSLNININPSVLGETANDARLRIQEMNEAIVIIEHANGYTHLSNHYYIDGVEAGENRSILNENQVKFKGILK